MLVSVEDDLLPLRERWDDITEPMEAELIDALLSWAWDLPDMQQAIREAYRDTAVTKEAFRHLLVMWLEGRPIVEIAADAGLEVDVMLGVYARVISYTLQVLIEQGVAVLKKLRKVLLSFWSSL